MNSWIEVAQQSFGEARHVESATVRKLIVDPRLRGSLHGMSVLVLGLAIAFQSACRSHSENAEPPLPQAPTAKVVTHKVADWEEFTGRFEAVEKVEIRPRASGYIDAVLFKEGQLVREGDVLYIIDPRPYQADCDRARAELALARSQSELATLEAERVHQLKDSGAVSAEELDVRLSNLRQQQAQVTASRAALAASELMLSFTKVRSPIDGRVSRTKVTRGNLVNGGASDGTLLTTVVSVDPIYVAFEGDEGAYLKYGDMVRRGNPSITRDGRNVVRVGLANESGFPHAGYMDFLDNQVDVRTGTIRARAVLENTDGRFTPGLFARVRLFGGATRDAILVADRAIGTDQNQRFVLAVTSENILEYRAITTGRLADGLRVVEGDLRSGDVIVTEGLHKLQAGMRIIPTPSTMSRASNVDRADARAGAGP